MEDDLAAAHRGVDPLVALYVALDDLDLSREVRQVLAVSGGEVVEHRNLVPALHEVRHEVRADETGSTGDKRSHAGRV